MKGYSQKIYSAEELKEKVTIRVLPEKMQIYPRFRDLVTKELGSDVCFVTTSLWEAFLLAMEQNPPVDDQLEIKFLRQNVQINIGCQILYAPKKARRTPGGAPMVRTPFNIEMRKNTFFPLLLDAWGTLSDKQKSFWRARLEEEGIIPAAQPMKPKRKRRSPPSVSTGKRKKRIKKFWKRMEKSMTIVSKRLRRFFRRK